MTILQHPWPIGVTTRCKTCTAEVRIEPEDGPFHGLPDFAAVKCPVCNRPITLERPARNINLAIEEIVKQELLDKIPAEAVRH